jgi:hypothetical protein
VRPVALLSELQRQGVTLQAEGDRLRVKAPKGTLTPEVRQALTAQKAELLRLLVDSPPPPAAFPREPPPADVVGGIPCADCGGTEWWRWLDGRLLCRPCLVRREHPIRAPSMWSGEHTAAVCDVADELPLGHRPQEAANYPQREVNLLIPVGSETPFRVHPAKVLVNPGVVEAHSDAGRRPEPHAVALPKVGGRVKGRAAGGRRPKHPPQDTRGQRSAGGITLELPYDRVVGEFLAEHPEWRTSPNVVVRYDRSVKGQLVGFTASAMNALLPYVTTCATSLSAPERDYYATFLTWLVDHGVPRVAHTPYRPAHVPDVLPGQLRLFV